MDTIFLYIFLGCIVVLFGCILYDNMKCKHEWGQHTFEKGGAKYYYITCKKCEKIKRLK